MHKPSHMTLTKNGQMEWPSQELWKAFTMFKDTVHTKKASQILKVLGNFYRLHIVTLLLNGEKNVSELNQSVKVSQPALSQHLAKLRREGILGARREQRQIFYYINNPHVIRVLGVLNEMVVATLDEANASKKPKKAG